MSVVDRAISNIMNWVTRIDQRYPKQTTIAQAGANNYQNTYKTYGDMPVYADASVERFIKEGYCGNASIYSIVKFISRKFSVVPRYLVKQEDERSGEKAKSLSKGLMSQSNFTKYCIARNKAYKDPETLKGNAAKFEQLCKRPNPRYGQDAYYFAVYAYYCLAGEAFVWLNRGDVDLMVNDRGELYRTTDDEMDKQPVLEKWVLPSHLMEIVPDPDDVFNILGYQINLDGKYWYIRKQDIIHWASFNPNFNITPREHLRGLPPLKPGNKIWTMDEDSTDAAVAMYQNGGARGVLFEKSLRNISPEQKAKIEEIVAKRISNKDMKSAVANLQGEWDYLDIGKDSVDMQLLDGNDKAFAKLCHLFGAPPGLFILDQTYENQRANRKRLLAETIIPDCQSFNDEENRVLLPAFGLRGYSQEPDYSELPEMQEDMKDMVETMKSAYWTPNEIRIITGQPELTIDGMDDVYIESSLKKIDEEPLDIESGFGYDKPAKV
jgi:HK97 family phage portal protein